MYDERCLSLLHSFIWIAMVDLVLVAWTEVVWDCSVQYLAISTTFCG